MAVRRDKTGRWRYRKWVRLPNGKKMRICGCPTINTKAGAEAEERAHIERVLNPPPLELPKKEVPTFAEWFNGRYWREWVISRKNKPSTVEDKRSVFKHHLEPVFGKMPVDKIKVGEIASFRASLVEQGLADKTVNNILAVLSKPLRYAYDVELIDRVPKVGLLKIEQPEIEFWEFDQYARILNAARAEGALEFAAICLAGEAGLRVGEVKALRWREDVDMIAKTITVNLQMRRGIVGTPKGRTRRTIPMTETLFGALKALSVVRSGVVIRSMSGKATSLENQIKNFAYRVCRRAGLPERGWHTLRHTFGTHCAMLGVNPWRLQAWMGHKLINETHRYVHVAEAHARETPAVILEAGHAELNPDKRVLKQLGARVLVPVNNDEMADGLGKRWAKTGANNKAPGDSRGLIAV